MSFVPERDETTSPPHAVTDLAPAPDDARAPTAGPSFPWRRAPTAGPEFPWRDRQLLEPIVSRPLVDLDRFVTRAVDTSAIIGASSAMSGFLDRSRNVQAMLDQAVPSRAVLDRYRVNLFPRMSVLPNFGMDLGRFVGFSSSFGSGWDAWLDDWPLNPAVSSLSRMLDLIRPSLLDVSTVVIGHLQGLHDWSSPWPPFLQGLRRIGARAAWWAVHRARAALEAGDRDALAEFLRDWLDATPTLPRLEALEEALLLVEPSAFEPEEGPDLLDAVGTQLCECYRGRYRDNTLLLDTTRRGSLIAPILGEDAASLRRLGMPDEPPVEALVLDLLEPDVDPRDVELVKALPGQDLAIALTKGLTGCAWSAAATHVGCDPARGEVVRRRLHRHHARLARTGAAMSYGPSPGRAADFGLITPALHTVAGVVERASRGPR